MAQLALAFDILARDRASKEFNNVGRAADNAGRKGTGFGQTMKRAAGVAAAAFATLGTVDFFKDSIAQARESQKVGAVTSQVLKTTGGAAKISAGQVGDLATAISNKSGIDDEAIQSGENLLLTFTGIRNEVGKGNDIFNRATGLVTDMSVALGQDMKSSSIQVGKALNDPIKGVTALQRVGVSFTDQQKEQIKTMVKSGDKLGAQKLILKELGKEFGGTAAASATMGDKAGVAFNNLKEQIGGLLIPILDKVAGWLTNKAIPAVSHFFSELQNGSGAGGKVRAVIDAIINAVKQFITEFQNGVGAGGAFRDALSTVGTVIQNVSKWISENSVFVGSLVAALLGGIGAFKVITTIVKAFTIVQGLLNVVMAANPIAIVVIAIAALATGLIYAYQKSQTFRDIVNGAFKAIAAAGRWLWNSVLAPVIRFLINGFATVADWIGNMLDALSHIPGFGWAKDAADKMHGAAAKAHELADGIKDIPDEKNVNVAIVASLRGSQLAINALTGQYANKRNVLLAARAGGGPVSAGMPYLVGENGPEIIRPTLSGMVYSAAQTRQMLSSGGGTTTAGYTRLHPLDIEAIVAGFARSRPVAVIDSGSVDRALAVRL